MGLPLPWSPNQRSGSDEGLTPPGGLDSSHSPCLPGTQERARTGPRASLHPQSCPALTPTSRQGDGGSERGGGLPRVPLLECSRRAVPTAGVLGSRTRVP